MTVSGCCGCRSFLGDHSVLGRGCIFSFPLLYILPFTFGSFTVAATVGTAVAAVDVVAFVCGRVEAVSS